MHTSALRNFLVNVPPAALITTVFPCAAAPAVLNSVMASSIPAANVA